MDITKLIHVLCLLGYFTITSAMEEDSLKYDVDQTGFDRSASPVEDEVQQERVQTLEEFVQQKEEAIKQINEKLDKIVTQYDELLDEKGKNSILCYIKTKIDEIKNLSFAKNNDLHELIVQINTKLEHERLDIELALINRPIKQQLAEQIAKVDEFWNREIIEATKNDLIGFWHLKYLKDDKRKAIMKLKSIISEKEPMDFIKGKFFQALTMFQTTIQQNFEKYKKEHATLSNQSNNSFSMRTDLSDELKKAAHYFNVDEAILKKLYKMPNDSDDQKKARGEKARDLFRKIYLQKSMTLHPDKDAKYRELKYELSNKEQEHDRGRALKNISPESLEEIKKKIDQLKKDIETSDAENNFKELNNYYKILKQEFKFD